MKQQIHIAPLFLIAGSLSLVALCSAASAKPFEQKCIGHLINDPQFGYQLAKNAKGDPFDGVTWCDATIEGALLKQVLAICPINSICRIEGLVEGHGTFSWKKINRVKQE
jgi:hypothetical protein